jgi:hypothetical protein
MSRFLKLSNRIINTAFIQRVEFDKDLTKYTLHMAQIKLEGSLLFGSGSVGTSELTIYACKKEHPESYKAIKDWIDHMP